MTVRVRYAPSPTGHLHIGGVRTALFNYLFARHHGGSFILRIEDTDLERNVPGAEEEMLRGFRWLGFEWDEGPDIGGAYGPYRCTERLEVYTEYLQKLVAQGAAYACYCTPEELKEEADKALAEGRVAKHSGPCRHLTDSEKRNLEAEGRKPSWRLVVPGGQILRVNDLVRGEVTFDTDEIGDFVIVKSNGIPTYQFQVVVDDALMKITHVIRGEEHLSNTPRQIVAYQALGFETPEFAHLPQVLNTDKKKLSKRDPNVKPVHEYREQGYLPQAIVNFLALLGWSPGGEEEILTLQQLFDLFDLPRVNKSGAVFDTEKLQWMAGTYLRQAPISDMTVLVQEQLERANISLPAHVAGDWLEQVVSLVHEHMVCAEDFVHVAEGFFHEEAVLDAEALEVLKDDVARQVVERYRELADADEEWTAEASRARFKTIQKELGVKGRALFMPVRCATTGSVHGPDLQKSIALLPKEWVLHRIEKALERA